MKKSKKIKNLFEKKYSFRNNNTFELPHEAFACAKWSIPTLQQQKDKLNGVKSLLNQYDLEEWSKHTKRRDPSSYIIKFIKQKFEAELVTQAWCKFYECLVTYSIVSKQQQIKSLHLCEAPGAFISALNHYLSNESVEWIWFANSLNPDYEGNSLVEMISDDRLLRHTLQNWYFGSDFTGNMTSYANFQDLSEKIPKVDLVTADGSIDCSSDPGNQEKFVEFLHFCETVTALSLLKQGGNFVLKIFTMFEDSTICLLYLLNVAFNKVHLFKPVASKGGNSEVYVICLGFKANLEPIWPKLVAQYRTGGFGAKSMFDLNQMDQGFLKQLLEASTFFTDLQAERIIDNIENFRKETKAETGRIHQVKISVANRFINKCKLSDISSDKRLVKNADVSTYRHYKKLSFVRNVCKFEESLKVVFDFKLGLKIFEVKSSRFCSVEFLTKFRLKCKKQGNLYKNLEKFVSATSLIINLGDFDCSSFYDFQKSLLYRIYQSKQDNIVFVKIPFLTNFLVGLLYILLSNYQTVYFHKNGLLVFCKNTKNNELRRNLSFVDESYQNLEKNFDICQIVSPDLFKGRFLEFVYNYNNIILSRL